MKKNNFKTRLSAATLLFAISTSLVSAREPIWAYDPGPDPKIPIEKELIDLTAEIANAPLISKEIVGRQRFRPAYGPIPWRMRLKPNTVKILFIGQDGTHIAEAANRPATAGFGGRAQDLARHFGVNEGAAFINNYAFTINGQYNTANTPYVDVSGGPGDEKVQTTTFLDNKFWLVSQDLNSPVTQWRNDLIEWIIRNNRESLKLIVAFGGAAKDGISQFIKSRGGRVNARLANKMTTDRVDVQVFETDIKGAGSNKQFAVALDRRGRDLYQQIEGRLDYTDEADQTKAISSIKTRTQEYLPRLTFTKGGPLSNGLLDPAQLGGFDIEKLSVTTDEPGPRDGIRNPITLEGLKLKDGSEVGEVLVVQLPHPTALSMMTPQDASDTVAERLKILDPYAKRENNPWGIQGDKANENPADETRFPNNYALGNPYRYARSDIDSVYYDFGTPASRMVSVSSASRMSGGGNSHIIVFGSRDRGVFDRGELARITEFEPAQKFDPKKDFFTTRPRSPEMRYVFDAGPNILNPDGSVKVDYARIMKENLDFKAIYRMKDGTEWDKDIRAHQEIAISNFNIKSHPMIADFGHYRGTFDNPQIVVLADPEGYDDMVTSRAITGERGQYLQGLMDNLLAAPNTAAKNYLVIKTVPFGMDRATDDEWEATYKNTSKYRKAIFDQLLGAEGLTATAKPKLIIADGKWAKKALGELLAGRTEFATEAIARAPGDKDSGIVEAGRRIANSTDARLADFARKTIAGERRNIPREHLTFYARIWEGTSGDRVLESGGELAGIAFAEIAPKWAFETDFALTAKEKPLVDTLKAELKKNKLPGPGESIPDFLENNPGLDPSI